MPKIINGVTCRTREESLKHIIKQAKAGKIGPKGSEWSSGSCHYKYLSGNHCAVGCLFSANQLKDIERRDFNSTSIAMVAQEIGQKNIEAVTGMTVRELVKLQRLHDLAVERCPGLGSVRTSIGKAVIDYCEKELAELANV